MEFDLMTIQSPVKMLSKYGIQIAHEEHKKSTIEKPKDQSKKFTLSSHRNMTSQEADIDVQKALASMEEVTDQSDEDDPNNKSFLSMIEAKKKYTLSLLAISDTKNDLEAKDSFQSILALMAGSKSGNDS
ncbi:hypothetical protein CQW23_29012 [Capsicum baccatum]|uniref:Uncharacterized protein n=1 Tax=Capsicum baccatum TaxID=33114 RepID=A0A2G2VI63_CAPBA|nr:hypothetical protein CQW23_29012 [Capsicum baccatum]